MTHKSRTISLQIKSVADDGTFEGLLSPYGNVDQGGDVVQPGAFTASLKANGNTVPMLWQHKPDCPIGELQLEDRDDGLYCKGKLLLDIPEAQKAYALLKAQVIKGLSIGYETVKAKTVNGVRQLQELKLYEGSVVTFPMNLQANVTSVKQHESKGDFSEELADRQLSDQSYQMQSALSSALAQLPWSGMSRDETLSAAETVLEQFSDAYLTYLPLYLDYLSREYGMDTKSWQSKREVKEGRTVSAATKKTLQTAHDHMTSACDAVKFLIGDVDECDCDDPDAPEDCNCDEDKQHADLLTKMFGLLRG